MADGLKKLLGLGNVERGSESGGGESSQDLSRFKSEFKKLIEEVNRDLGSIAPILGEDRQRDLSARRDKTYAAYQLAVTAIGTGGAEESTSGDLADRVLASVRTLQAMVAKVKESANQEREAWGDCDNRIEAARKASTTSTTRGSTRRQLFRMRSTRSARRRLTVSTKTR